MFFFNAMRRNNRCTKFPVFIKILNLESLESKKMTIKSCLTHILHFLGWQTNEYTRNQKLKEKDTRKKKICHSRVCLFYSILFHFLFDSILFVHLFISKLKKSFLINFFFCAWDNSFKSNCMFEFIFLLCECKLMYTLQLQKQWFILFLVWSYNV